MTAIGINTIKAKMRITEVLNKTKRKKYIQIGVIYASRRGNNLMMQLFLMIFYDL